MRYFAAILLLLIYTIEPFVWSKAISTLTRKFSNKIYYKLAGVGYYILTVIKQFGVFWNLNSMMVGISNILLVVYIFSVAINMFSDSLYKKIMCMVIFGCLIAATELPFVLTTAFCFHVPMQIIGQLGMVNCACTLGAKLLLIVVCRLFYYGKKTRYIKLIYDNPEILPLTFINLMVEILASYIYRDAKFYKNSSIMLIFACIQISIIINAVYIVLVLVRKNRRLSCIEEKMMKNRQILDLTMELRQLKHDMSCHVGVIRDLTHRKCYQELEEYVDSSFRKLDIAEDVYILSDSALSSVLSLGMKQAKEKNIKLHCMVFVDDFYISSHDLCSIVSNILNNAMEATEKLDENRKYIDLEISNAEGGYNINCINPCDGNVNFFQTSKQDKRNHGLGIRIIKQTTEKNRGVMRIIPHDSCFEINCFIPKPEERGEVK